MKTNTLALLFLFSMLILPCQAQTIIKTSMNGQTIDILQICRDSVLLFDSREVAFPKS